MKKTVDQKLNVKPIYVNLVHRYSYEGPCRYGEGEELTPEYDKRKGMDALKAMKEFLPTVISKDVNLLEPVLVEWTDEFILKDEQLKIVEADLNITDVFLVAGHLSQYYAMKLAEKYRKPIGVVGSCMSTDSSAYLKSIGLEGYSYIDFKDAGQYFPFLRAKKGIANTRVLSVLKDDIITKGVVSGIRNLDYLTQKYGIEFEYINAEEVLDAVANLNEEGVKQATEIADNLLSNAEFSYVKREYVINSAKYYVTVKNLLEKYECNAFTTPCFEICATRRLDKDKYTFCLAHSLLKEEGIPSACEADMNVFIAMDVLMNITKSAPHMGNTHPLTTEQLLIPSDCSSEVYKEKEEKFIKMNNKNIIYVHHAVPTRYMKGRDKEAAPYGIQAFTCSGWGATIRYDYNRDIGEEITLLRADPTGSKWFAANAKIVGSIGYKAIGCETGFLAEVADIKDFFKKESQFGHHYAWVYGDVREKLKELGELMGIEVVTA